VCRSVASDPAAADFTSVAIQKTPWIGSQSLLLMLGSLCLEISQHRISLARLKRLPAGSFAPVLNIQLSRIDCV
jgi:hypothetical protein